jgi:excisionase family DNA binding protein
MLLDKEAYLVGEVARQLGVNRQTVTTLIAKGQLQAVNISSGKKPIYRIPKKALEEFLKRRTVEVSTTEEELKRRKDAVREILSKSFNLHSMTAADLVRAGRRD